jgi:hypothetical protein
VLAVPRRLIVGIVDPDEHAREAIGCLLEIELGVSVRSAPTLDLLKTTLSSTETLTVIVARQVLPIKSEDRVLPYVIDPGRVPFDGGELINRIKAKLAGDERAA